MNENEVDSRGNLQIKTIQNVKHFVRNIKEKNLFKDILQSEHRNLKECEYLLEKITRMKFFETFITSVFSGTDYI